MLEEDSPSLSGEVARCVPNFLLNSGLFLTRSTAPLAAFFIASMIDCLLVTDFSWFVISGRSSSCHMQIIITRALAYKGTPGHAHELYILAHNLHNTHTVKSKRIILQFCIIIVHVNNWNKTINTSKIIIYHYLLISKTLS